MHDFMKATADGVNRKLREDGHSLERLVTADDLEIKIEFTAHTLRPSGLAFHPAVIQLVYKDLDDSMA